jgi:O-antigen/teichoic acid export membrane protein
MARDTSITFATHGASLAINLLTGILVARALGASGRGELTAIFVPAQMVSWIFAIGAAQAIAYHLARHPHSGGALISTWLLLLAPMSLAGILAGQAILPVILDAQSEEVYRLARLFMLTVVLGLVDELMAGVLLGDHAFTFFNLRRLATLALVALGYVALLLGGVFTVNAALIVNLVVTGIGAAIVATWVIRRHGLSRPSLELARTTVWYAVRVHGTTLGQEVNARLDLLILPAFVGAASIGHYSLATSVAFIVVALGGTLAQILLPVAARQAERGIRTVMLSLHVTIVASILVAVVIGASAGLLVPRIYGSEFLESVLPLRILLPGAAAWAAASVLSAGLQALGRPLAAAASQLTGVLITAVGLLLFLPAYGILAAASVSTVAYFIVLAISVALYRRAARIGWNEFKPDTALIRTRVGSMGATMLSRARA